MLSLSRDEVRELDRLAIEEIGIPGIVLMENAGRGVAEYLLSQYVQGKIMVCCGKGNNAGDGFAAARHLDNHDLPVHILLFANPDDLKGDAKINYEIAVKSSLNITIVGAMNLEGVINHLSDAAWIVDALFGTGFKGELKSPYNKIVKAINQAHTYVL